MKKEQKFDAAAEVARLKTLKKNSRKSVYRRSKLERYRAELIAMRAGGASATVLRDWLQEKRIKVHLSTVTRWLEKSG